MPPPNSFTGNQHSAPITGERGILCLVIHEGVRKAATETSGKFSAAIQRGLTSYDWWGSQRDEILVLFGKRGATQRLIASNLPLRLDATYIMADQLHQLREASVAILERSFWHVSFLGPIITEYKPEIDVDAYRHAVYRLLSDAGLNAIFTIEFQALTNYPQRGEGRGFLMNAHAVCWSDDPMFDEKKTQASMRKSGIIFSELGAPIATITPRTLEIGQIEYLAHYMLKAPFEAKRRAKDDVIPTKWVFKPATARDDQLLRLGELISHFELPGLVSGVGAGREIRKAWKKELVHLNRLRCARLKRSQPLDTHFDVSDLWTRIRKRGNGSRHYAPLRLFGPLPRPLGGECEPRQSGTRLRPSQRRFQAAQKIRNTSAV